MTNALRPWLVLGWPIFFLFATISPAHAALRFAEPVADAGIVRAGTPFAHHFTFVNEGPQPVQVTQFRASCGCLKPKVSKSVLQPGEKGEMTLEVNTLTQAEGPHTWQVKFCYCAGDTCYEMSLELKAKLVREVSVQPGALVVYADRPISHEIILTDLRAKPLTITEIRTSSRNLKSALGEKCLDEFGHQVCKIDLAVGQKYSEGRHDEVVGIFTNDPLYREIRVPVTVIKRPRHRVSALPSEVKLTAFADQPFPARIVLIRDQENENVVVDSVEADDPAVVCQWAHGPDAMATVRINVNRRRLSAGELQTKIHVHIKKPAPQILTIPITCTTR